MSETPQEDRKHEPSARKLDRAHEEGQVAVGRDVVMVAVLIAGTLGLALVAGRWWAGCVALVRLAATSAGRAPPIFLLEAARSPLLLVLGVAVLTAGAGIAATVAQTRIGFWPSRIVPDLSRLTSGGQLTRVLQGEFVLDLGLSILKVVALSVVVFFSLRDELLTLPDLLQVPVERQLGAIWSPLLAAGVKVLAALAVIAGLDFALARYRQRRKLRMTDEELKREHREEEGEPLLKSRRRQRHREMAKGRPQVEVPRADVLIVNPTHVAVALRYRRDESAAPRVTAKGKGQAAEYMRELARTHGVPIYEDIPLARLLHRKVKVGQEIPAETYQAVAAALAFVYRITGRRPGEARPGEVHA
ncbi:MAG: EscU/YscU/HrcU family type III secretion system export apparatus switch protein [Deltaproteobacteria bacterium]|nr:MAG: EscU/YscU/HrcU family type III secretion system export apparatus switch protein [Deltaproteobacteria bacterium]